MYTVLPTLTTWLYIFIGDAASSGGLMYSLAVMNPPQGFLSQSFLFQRSCFKVRGFKVPGKILDKILLNRANSGPCDGYHTSVVDGFDLYVARTKLRRANPRIESLYNG